MTHYEDIQSPSLVFTLDVYPEVIQKDTKWEKIKKSPYNTDVTKDEIETTINQLRSSYATFEDVSAIDKEVLVRAKVTYSIKDTILGNAKNQYLGREEIEPNKDLTKLLTGKVI